MLCTTILLVLSSDMEIVALLDGLVIAIVVAVLVLVVIMLLEIVEVSCELVALSTEDGVGVVTATE